MSLYRHFALLDLLVLLYQTCSRGKTDSINDLPLCEFADEVFTINPCRQLRPIAEQRGWEILPWSM